MLLRRNWWLEALFCIQLDLQDNLLVWHLQEFHHVVVVDDVVCAVAAVVVSTVNVGAVTIVVVYVFSVAVIDAVRAVVAADVIVGSVTVVVVDRIFKSMNE